MVQGLDIKYLRDGNRVFHVEHAVPPSTGHEHGLPRLLSELDGRHVAVRALDAR